MDLTKLALSDDELIAEQRVGEANLAASDWIRERALGRSPPARGTQPRVIRRQSCGSRNVPASRRRVIGVSSR
jgi:hypothetical protein